MCYTEMQWYSALICIHMWIYMHVNVFVYRIFYQSCAHIFKWYFDSSLIIFIIFILFIVINSSLLPSMSRFRPSVDESVGGFQFWIYVNTCFHTYLFFIEHILNILCMPLIYVHWHDMFISLCQMILINYLLCRYLPSSISDPLVFFS